MSLKKTAARLSVLTLATGLLWPSPSQAYKMMYNTSSTTSLNVNCDYTNGFGHWSQPTMYWYYNPAGQGSGKGFAVIDALETWTDATQSDHVLQYAGTTSAGLNINDNQNTIVWASTSSLCTGNACHAITVVRYTSQQVHLETDIVLNELMDWRTDGLSDPCTSTSAGTKVDTQAILTHELGHTLGLGHTTDSTATMGGSSCSLAGRTPNSDDLAGLQCSTNRYPFTPAYEGFLDGYAGFNCSQISGWAWNGDWPNESVYVNIRDGSSLEAVLPAAQYRSDLVAAGKGDGEHGFIYPVPSNWKNGQWHTIHAQFSGTGSDLTWSPKSLICDVPLFPDTLQPTQDLPTNGVAYEVATQFSSSVSGKITALGYNFAAGETGSHLIRLLSDTGAELGSTTISPTGASYRYGSIPAVAIQAGVLYRVAITTFTEQSKTPCSLPLTNGPLTAHQGFWKQNAGGLPNTSSCSNFHVSVRFEM